MLHKMLNAFKNGFLITLDALKYMKKNPKILVPVILIKILYIVLAGVIVLYTPLLTYLPNNSSDVTLVHILVGIYVLIVYVKFFESLSALYSLDLIRQKNNEGSMGLFRGFIHIFTRSVIKALPIILIWSLMEMALKIVIALLQVFLGRKRSRLHRGAGDAGNVLTRTLRMISLVSLPMIVWKEKGTFASLKESFKVFKKRFGVVFVGLGINHVFYSLMGLPAILAIYLADRYEFISLEFFIGLAIYLLLIWSVAYIVEILFSTRIYLWYASWQTEKEAAESRGENPPALDSVEKPDFLSGHTDAIISPEQ